MFRFKGKVVYTDGREEAFETGNAALAAWERYAARNGLPMGNASPATLSSLVIAHHALGIEQGVDGWIETVNEIELDAEQDGVKVGAGSAVPPTPEAPSTV